MPSWVRTWICCFEADLTLVRPPKTGRLRVGAVRSHSAQMLKLERKCEPGLGPCAQACVLALPASMHSLLDIHHGYGPNPSAPSLPAPVGYTSRRWNCKKEKRMHRSSTAKQPVSASLLRGNACQGTARLLQNSLVQPLCIASRQAKLFLSNQLQKLLPAS